MGIQRDFLYGSEDSNRGIGVASTDQKYFSGPKDSSSRVTIQVTAPKEEQDYKSNARDSDFYQYSTSVKKGESKADYSGFRTYPLHKDRPTNYLSEAESNLSQHHNDNGKDEE